jgi:hypothetical protein
MTRTTGTETETAAAELVGIVEIREFFVRPLSDNIEAITFRDDFPEPAASLIQGQVWFQNEVETWFTTHRDVLADLFRTDA